MNRWILVLQTIALPLGYCALFKQRTVRKANCPYVNLINDSDGNRTRVTAVKGRCLNRLTTEPYSHSFSYCSGKNLLLLHILPIAPRAGLEPATTRLTAECSTIELSRIISRVHTLKTKYQKSSSHSDLSISFRYTGKNTGVYHSIQKWLLQQTLL